MYLDLGLFDFLSPRLLRFLFNPTPVASLTLCAGFVRGQLRDGFRSDVVWKCQGRFDNLLTYYPQSDG